MTPLKSVEVTCLQQRSGCNPKCVVWYFRATVVNCMFFLLLPSHFLAFQPPSNPFSHSALGSINKLKKNNLPFLSLNIVLAAVHSDILSMGFLHYGLKLPKQYFLLEISYKLLKLPYANCHSFWMASAVCFTAESRLNSTCET